MFFYVYAVDLGIFLGTIWTFSQSMAELIETFWDYRSERDASTRTSETAYVRTWENVKVEMWQMAQVTMLLWFGARLMYTPPPNAPGMFLDASQFGYNGLWIFLGFVLLKAGGRRAERNGRRRSHAMYLHEFGPGGKLRIAEQDTHENKR
jgi:hypothetical protein